MPHGISLRPADTLLVARAHDVLAAGPADAVLLAERVCQMPGVSRAVAEQIVSTLLAGRTDFVRDDLGWWRLAGSSPAPIQAPRAPAPPEAPSVPTFEEWLASRKARGPARAEAAARLTIAADSPVRTDVVSEPVRPRYSPAVVPACERSSRALPGDEVPLSSLSYVVVDVETTGGNPRTGHRITEIAAVLVRDGRVQEPVFETLVNPERSIPPMITAITNINWEMVRDKPRFREICPGVIDALAGHVFVAHNAAFDWKFVAHEIERATGQTMDGRKLCTVRLARRLLPQLPRRSLDWVARHYGVDIAARHRAAGDAVATAHCLVRLLKDAEARGISTWGQLDILLGARTAATRRRRKSELSLPRSAGGEEGA